MFIQLFEIMNDMLEDIIRQYPTATEAMKHEMEQEWNALKKMSDSCIEQWLLFQEKMEHYPQPAAAGQTLEQYISTGNTSESFKLGQGYFNLFMFDRAVSLLEDAVKSDPDFMPARLYLALGFLQLGQFAEAYRHFQLIIPLTENANIKAISYNALGCIQANNSNMEKAVEYFRLADQAHPFLP